MRAAGSGGTVGSGGVSAGRSSQHSKASSVRFLDGSFDDGDDDTRSVMSGFEHRYKHVSSRGAPYVTLLLFLFPDAVASYFYLLLAVSWGFLLINRYISQVGSRDPKAELEAMEKTLSQMSRRTR